MSQVGRGSVTIADVARAAGVSRATASRALNDSSLVTDATKKRVREAVEQTGFVMNAQGRALALGRAETIAVVVTEPLDELFEDPTYAVVLRGITERLAQTRFLPILLQASSGYERDRALRHFQRRSVDAIIDISPYVGGSLLEALADSSLPVVLCGQLEGDPYRGVFSSVYADDVAGATLAAQAMVARGRSTVAAILGPEDNPAATDRYRGYREVLGEALDPDLVVFTGWDSVSGMTAMRELLSRCDSIDGVLACSDRIAAGAVATLKGMGKAIPGDVSIVGFDDHAIAAVSDPPLTTVHQPLREEGRTAAEVALAMIDGAEPSTTVLTMELVTRESL